MLIALIRNRHSFSRSRSHHHKYSFSKQKSMFTVYSGGGKGNNLSSFFSYPRNEVHSI